MVDIEKTFYTQAMRQAALDDTPEKLEEIRQEIIEYENNVLDKQPEPAKVLNPERLKWFESLTESAIDFAQTLDLDLVMKVEGGLHGYIRFETSFFQLDDRDGPLAMAFWTHLCEAADSIIITHCDDRFKMELYFNLYNVPEED